MKRRTKRRNKGKKRFNFPHALLDGAISTVLVFIVFVIAPYIFNFGIIKAYWDSMSDFKVSDIGFSQLVDPNYAKGDTNIVIFNIRDMDNAALSQLVMSLNANKPRIIGINKVIKKENSIYDSVLAFAFKNVDHLVLASRFYQDTTTNQYDIIDRSDEMFLINASTGYSNLLFDRNQYNSTVRDFYPTYKLNLSTEYLFSVKVALAYNPKSVERLLTEENKKTINWEEYRKFLSITNVSDLGNSLEAYSFVRDKIVLLGVYDSESDPNDNHYYLDDKYFTPINPNYAGRTYPDMFETDIHANIISMILEDNYLYVAPAWLNYLFSVVFCFLVMILYIYIKYRIDPWYELLTVVIFFIFSASILLITIYSIHWYSFDLQINEALLALAISSPVFEAYYQSIKVIFLKIYKSKRRKT